MTERNRDAESSVIWEIENKVIGLIDLPDRSFLWSALQRQSDQQPFDDLYVVAFDGFTHPAGSFAVRYSEAREALEAGGALLDALIQRLASEMLGYEAGGAEHHQEKIDLANVGLQQVDNQMAGLRQQREYLVTRQVRALKKLMDLVRQAQEAHQ